MALTLPDPREAAREEAARIMARPEQYLDGPVQRKLLDAPFVAREPLLAGLEAFHRERMAKVPSAAAYPEAAPWVAHILAVDRELQAIAGLSDRQMAILRSLGPYLMFRGYLHARAVPAGPPATAEKCRVAFLPATDQGRLHIKNVDDPLTFWTPRPAPATLPKSGPLVLDGVGFGLHIDDEPAEIFPLDPRAMVRHYADDVPGAVAFLTRYRTFWGSANLLLQDAQGRAAAIEKPSYNFIEVFGPDRCGAYHISGMTCRDQASPQAQYVAAKRRQMLALYGQPEDCCDVAYWNSATAYGEKLAGFLDRPASPTVQETLDFFTTPAPDGLNKWGAQFHPDQGYRQYTLVTEAALLDRRRFLRWQRDTDGVYPSAPEVYQF